MLFRSRTSSHLHIAARALSNSAVKTKIYFVMFDIVVKNKSNVVERGVHSCQRDTRHHSSQNLLRTHSAAPCESTTYF